MFGIGSVLLTYRLGRLMFSPAVGFWSGLILASCLNFNVIARAATPDSFLVFFSTLAMLLFVSGTAKARAAVGRAQRAQCSLGRANAVRALVGQLRADLCRDGLRRADQGTDRRRAAHGRDRLVPADHARRADRAGRRRPAGAALCAMRFDTCRDCSRRRISCARCGACGR